MDDYNDFQAQQAAIDRQRKIASLLQAQSMAPDPGQMVSGHYVGSSPVASLAKIVQALVGGSNQAALDSQQADLQQNINADRLGTLQRYTDLMQGQPAVPASYRESTPPAPDAMGPNPGELVSPSQAAIAPNRGAAMQQLVNSQNPLLQQFGTLQMLKYPSLDSFYKR